VPSCGNSSFQFRENMDSVGLMLPSGVLLDFRIRKVPAVFGRVASDPTVSRLIDRLAVDVDRAERGDRLTRPGTCPISARQSPPMATASRCLLIEMPCGAPDPDGAGLAIARLAGHKRG